MEIRIFKSSINFQKAKAGCFVHNDRSGKNPNYLLDVTYRKNEYDKSALEATELRDKLWIERIAKAKPSGLQKKNCVVEAVVNIKPETTMEQLQELAGCIEKEFGFTLLQCAIHGDEGKRDGDTMGHFNTHAHLVFFTLDENGKQMFRLEHITKAKLRGLQDFVAYFLEMDRGVDSRESGRKRLNHYQYKQVAQREEKLQLEILDIRNKSVEEKGILKNEITSLFHDKLKMQTTIETKELLYKETRELLKATEAAKQKDYQELKALFDAEKMRPKLDVDTVKAVDFMATRLAVQTRTIEKITDAVERQGLLTKLNKNDIQDIAIKVERSAANTTKQSIWEYLEKTEFRVMKTMLKDGLSAIGRMFKNSFDSIVNKPLQKAQDTSKTNDLPKDRQIGIDAEPTHKINSSSIDIEKDKLSIHPIRRQVEKRVVGFGIKLR
jgi:hypothetical protein